MRLPELIIAGAPKCGTTSLFDWLTAHPMVWGTPEKEVRFFLDDGYPLQRRASPGLGYDEASYAERFCAAPRDAVVVVDATPDYFYQVAALQHIPRLTSQPSVIFVLRNPAARLRSMFQFAQNNMASIDSTLDFPGFVDDIARGRVSAGVDPLVAAAAEHSRYSKFLADWRRFLPPSRMLVIIFEEMVARPRDAVRAILGRFDMDLAFYDRYGFPSRNRTVAIRSKGLHRFKRAVVQALPSLRHATTLRSIYSAMNKRVIESERGPDKALPKRAAAFLDELVRSEHDWLANECGVHTPWPNDSV
jgi:hypothetical protein